jgi:hypothetical protein
MNTNQRSTKDLVVAAIFWGAIIGVAIGLGASFASAQTTPDRIGPIQLGEKWEVIIPENVTTPADALTFEMRVSRNGQPLTALVNPACQARPADYAWSPARGRISCIAPISQSNLDALNIIGNYEMRATFFRADVGESAPLASPFVLRSPAGAPRGLRITP